ncbi:MAG: nucleoside/nucleotide kinase family protein [Pseudomonadota bacterium]
MPEQGPGPDELATQIVSALEGRIGPHRTLVALAGPPGVGKSTVAEAVLTALVGQGISAALVPMDGYHLDNAILRERDLLHRKGAPETFDLAGFTTLIERLTRDDEVVYPVFDRTLDCAIAGRGRVAPEHQVIVVEGNYLLLEEPGWRALAQHWDLSVFLSAPMPTLSARLAQRWLDHGLPPADAAARAEANDLPNARRVAGARLPADLVLGAAT